MGQEARKRIAILGSTGSVGVQALDLVARFPERFEIVALAAGTNGELLARQIHEHRPALAAINDESRRKVLEPAAREAGTRIVAGAEGIDAVATHPDADIVLSAIVGAAGLRPTQHALAAGRTVALANKESLVMAGALMRRTAEQAQAELIPVDSEHSALHQCLRGESIDEVRRLILTASGGPFRTTPIEELSSVTPEQALKHPVWDMGRKISIDSATMMNKGLEVIEAHWLFDVPPERIDVVLHPQSFVHSMVEMIDGAIICQMGMPDMRGPLQYALGYPRRFAGPVPPLDVGAEGSLNFDRVDRQRFPCLDLAYAALTAGGTAPAVLNGANEVAVQAFLDGRIGYLGIPRLVKEVLEGHRPRKIDTIEDVMQADRWSRRAAEEMLSMRVFS